MKLFNYFTLFVAIILSICAAYYSIIGLAAIFAAAVIPIIIMGTVLELAKVTGAVWLHINWHQAKNWIKIYMVFAVLALMLITSMGIFGFLSRAHIQQTAETGSGFAQIERIESEIARQEETIRRAEIALDQLQDGTAGAGGAIQIQIDREQERLDQTIQRLRPDLEQAQARLESIVDDRNRETFAISQEIDQIQAQLSELESALQAGENERVQTIVGVTADGVIGPQTRSAIENYESSRQTRLSELQSRLQNINESYSDRIALAEQQVQEARSIIREQTQSAENVIQQLRDQIGTTSRDDLEIAIDRESDRISLAQSRIEELLDEQFAIQARIRSLEAEVGPIRYVAELIYGEQPDQATLERAVRWMIILIVSVFDPLAIALILAATNGIMTHSRREQTEPKETTVPVNLVIPEPETPKESSVKQNRPTKKESYSETDMVPSSLKKRNNTPEEVKAKSNFDFKEAGSTTFGTTWPAHPVKGDLFLKVDVMPNKLYRWSGRTWQEIDKVHVDDNLVEDNTYIDYLIKELRKGRADWNKLTKKEQEQVTARIKDLDDAQ